MKQICMYLITSLVMVLCICDETGASFTNFVFKRFEVCNNTQLQMKFYGQITRENGKQYLTYNLTVPFPLGDNVGVSCLIQGKSIGNTFVELITVREKNLCKAFNKYMGEFWYDLERESQITPGVCPIQEDGADATFTNFDIKKFEVCNNTKLAITYQAHITKENGNQYLSHNITLPYNVGNNLGSTCLIQAKTVGNIFTDLFTIRERNFCRAFNKYLGEFWYDIERESHMAPGVCPMQKGRYNGHHVLLQFEKISLQTFPFGTLRFTMNAIDNSNKDVVWCLFLEVENVLN